CTLSRASFRVLKKGMYPETDTILKQHTPSLQGGVVEFILSCKREYPLIVRKTAGFYFVFCILIVFSPARGYSQSGDQSRPELISGISIEGLKRTKVYIAERPLQKFIGMKAELVDFDEVKAAVLGTGILDPLEVEIRDNTDLSGKILRVKVHEKWTIIPIPVFFAGSGGISAGAAFMDMNAFGINDKFALSGMYRSGGWMAAAFYMHAPGQSLFPGWNAALMYSRTEEDVGDQEDRSIRTFGLQRIRGSLGLSYGFGEYVSASLSAGYDDKSIKKIDKPRAVPESGSRHIETAASLSFNKNFWDGYFLSQAGFRAAFSYAFALESSSYYSVETSAVYEKSIVPGFRTSLRAALIYAPDAPALCESSPASAGTDILPRSFSARNYAASSLGFEKYLFRMKMGVFSISAAYQVVYSEGPILGDRFDHGIAGALRFYMTRLAMPALGMGLSYDIEASHVQAYFSLGMSF
ncbi:BamA/TamA family outer membrane protein, partial [Treponema sp. OttesenSCG-928-L16]|nr:BamA/TamA family outer membrane protein [Treponema sp. OttesenSCG-928-L16]